MSFEHREACISCGVYFDVTDRSVEGFRCPHCRRRDEARKPSQTQQAPHSEAIGTDPASPPASCLPHAVALATAALPVATIGDAIRAAGRSPATVH
jgi:hypothetical protein